MYRLIVFCTVTAVCKIGVVFVVQVVSLFSLQKMADDVDQGYTWENEYERTWYVIVFIFDGKLTKK